MNWNDLARHIMELIEQDECGSPSLSAIARRLGYSPYYCSRKFHESTGMSIREYISRRRIDRAAEALRNSDNRIIDVAVDSGFSSHEALTRAFVSAFGISPNAYRTSENSKTIRSLDMVKPDELAVSVEFIPAHFFIGVRDIEAKHYFDFWDRRGSCDEIAGSLKAIMDGGLESVPRLQLGGWYYENGKKGYLYGIMVPLDYDGAVPASCEKVLVPGGNYVCARHPAYDYAKDEDKVDKLIWKAIHDYPLKAEGLRWDETRPTWQRHFPEEYGQAVVKPVARLK
ncbi:MAG: helix-turn-helix transcriptional regulator [Spirochaetales bacterium]|nr:helix-turn-helix transcriptional regulator [Spirochaetales bacterium]